MAHFRSDFMAMHFAWAKNMNNTIYECATKNAHIIKYHQSYCNHHHSHHHFLSPTILTIHRGHLSPGGGRAGPEGLGGRGALGGLGGGAWGTAWHRAAHHPPSAK